jgi:hypothetical protein
MIMLVLFLQGIGILLALLVFVGPIVASAIIVKKAGYSPLWAALILIPIVNFAAIYMFSNASWPALASRGND